MADWLSRVQMPNGAFPDAGLRRASPLNSAHAAQGLREASRLARAPQLRAQLETLAQGARDYLAGAIDGKCDKRGNATLPACSDTNPVTASFLLWQPPDGLAGHPGSDIPLEYLSR
jgi:hypothetical protein